MNSSASEMVLIICIVVSATLVRVCSTSDVCISAERHS